MFELIKVNVKMETKKFDFFIVEELPFIEGIEEIVNLQISGFLKLSISL